ncbi:MAG: hypothetical protein SH820_17205 [Xanthomonadales bacterium]|nr:hypothetical protein [Xanthomonadales bacterium]
MSFLLKSGRLASLRAIPFILLSGSLCFSPLLQAQALSPEQQQKAAAVESGLKRVQTNFQLALDSAGTGTPTGSKAKLSKMRLDSAAVDMPQLKQWLSELPADQPEVKPLTDQYASIEQGIQELDDRIAGKNATPAAATAAAPAASTPATTATATPAAATAPAPATAPAQAATPAPAADATVKLGYPLEDVLKGAQFNLREVQGNANALTAKMAELQPVEDQLSVNFREVLASMNTLENARRKAGFTQDGLSKLPANGQGVAEAATELAEANGQLDTAETYFAPLNQQLAKLIDPANYPNLPTDLKRLDELTVMYGSPSILQTDRPQAAAVMHQADAAKTEATRIAQAYSSLMVQQTEEGKRVEGSGNYFLEKLTAFQAAAEQERQTLPQQIRADLAEADKVAQQAVADQKPLFFTGGIPQTMGFAADRLALYKVLDPKQAPAMEKEVQAMQASMVQREKSLSALIIQQNPLPPDRYTGADRSQVVDVAIDAWKHQQAKFEVLGSRIPSEAWNRETMWQYSNGTWYYVDRSKLQVQLLVADEENSDQAKILPVNIWKDHQKGDSLIGTPLYSGKEVLQPSSYMLRDKIK